LPSRRNPRQEEADEELGENMNIDSKDYHDFVIKDGKLIGEFEQMYQKSAEVPWHQDIDSRRLDVRIAIELLRDLRPVGAICDIGCGLGYFLDAVWREIGIGTTLGVGIDVSKTACEKAKELFPRLVFEQRNLMSEDFSPIETSLVTIRGVLWYVTPKLETAIMNVKRCCRPGGRLLVAQNFPPLDSDFSGKDKIPNPEALHAMFKDDLSTIRTAWMESKDSSGNDNWFYGLYRKN